MQNIFLRVQIIHNEMYTLPPLYLSSIEFPSVTCLFSPPDRPMPPARAVVVSVAGRSVILSWAEPDDDGGCKIGNYIVEYYRVKWGQVNELQRIFTSQYLCTNYHLDICTFMSIERHFQNLSIFLNTEIIIHFLS
jgi:hypothetical protein